MTRLSDSPCQRVPKDVNTNFLALFPSQLFGIIEKGVAIFAWQDDCRGHYGTCQAASAGFVTASFYQVMGVGRSEHAVKS